MRIIGCYDSGAILPQEVINIDPASLLTAFQSGIKNLAGLSLEAGYPIEATIPLILTNSFKNIAALSLESGYFFNNFRYMKIQDGKKIYFKHAGVNQPAEIPEL